MVRGRDAKETFRARLADLVSASGLSLRDIARASGVDFRTISDWTRGKHVPQRDEDLLLVVRVCIPAARKKGVAKAGWLGERQWLEDLNAARQAWTAQVQHHKQAIHPLPVIGENSGARRADVRSNVLPTRMMPVMDWEPHTLGVHPATLPRGSWRGVETTGLTPYLERAHDTELREEINRLAAGGQSLFALLGSGQRAARLRHRTMVLLSGIGLLPPGFGGWLRRQMGVPPSPM